MSIELNFITTLTFILFIVGLVGITINRKNIIMILLSIEILILSINLNFATLSIYLDDFIGNLFVVFILTIAAAESAIGLSLITCLFKLKDFIELKPVKKRQNKI